jgi:tRNA (guanine37-N1)-methyltransferase
MPKDAISLKIPKNQGEKAIALAVKMKFFDKSLEIGRDEKSLYVPLLRKPKGNELTTLKAEIKNAEVTTTTFAEKKPVSQTLIQILQDKLPPHLLARLPQAFDIIGDIAIVEIPPELKIFQTLIGNAIIQIHKNINTVLSKAGDVSGVYRVREYTFLAGENKTQTIHREFGCQYHVDVAKAYFSPRLSHEHQRVASLVQSREIVVDLFAGVGPFSILIGKKTPEVKVYAVDLNPAAIELLKVNVRINRVENLVFPLLADAREIAITKLKGVADRVIMNLPETAIDFIGAACETIRTDGGTIHFYAFIKAPDTIDNLKQTFTYKVEKNGREVDSFLYSKSIRETAPFESQVVLDAKIV